MKECHYDETERDSLAPWWMLHHRKKPCLWKAFVLMIHFCVPLKWLYSNGCNDWQAVHLWEILLGVLSRAKDELSDVPLVLGISLIQQISAVMESHWKRFKEVPSTVHSTALSQIEQFLQVWPFYKDLLFVFTYTAVLNLRWGPFISAV